MDNSYIFSYTAATLMLHETHEVIKKYLEFRDWDKTKDFVIEENVMQKQSVSSRKRVFIEIKRRIESLTSEELEYFNSEIDLVGINNRNLKDFKVDLQHSVNLKNLLPKGTLSVAESGIYNVEDFKFLKEKGFDAFLMGEYFMKNENPGKMFEEFVDVII